MHIAGVGEAGFFFHGKRVEFSSEKDRRAAAVFQYGDDARAANMLGDIVSSCTQAGRELGRGLGFVPRELWVFVEIEIERVSVRINSVYFMGCRRLRASCHRCGEEQ